uniref:Uncharacterized protein n=1 Tax=Arundo donax TaxID=35708 RepID=A0A0A9H6T5_ARUDO
MAPSTPWLASVLPQSSCQRVCWSCHFLERSWMTRTGRREGGSGSESAGVRCCSSVRTIQR